MYTPDAMKLSDKKHIFDFIDAYSFGLVVSPSLNASHLPFILDRSSSSQGILLSHMARANPLWKEFDGQRVLAIFQGPHSYVSPTWYQTAPAVPTWNYTSVHCYGNVSLLSVDELRIVMEALVHKFEPTLQAQKEIMPRTFIEGKLKGIIGFKIEIEELQAKEKLGQHRSQADQRGTLQGLINSQSSESIALADYMLKVKKGIGA
ncbi:MULTISPECIES: FMN-binding negative transcriptional regulator [Klebsiella]|uniref:Protease synthase and sporulation protein PAI 2 n=1 Tax=Klebsiella pasteurii TaxID=2587529 RepID=A0A9Q9S4M6_9ENTR|nr:MULTISPECIES: FMN-binding negative transcriptional regulator [Klebsiella]MCW9584165.1 FMN-binding negative transcriptional regulator [Klebsiella pasteurii]MDD9661734.1 FMN-binding negative transcriptional regulator [Klebsiella pasteurii]MDD9667776.1 FMN-binding negative transcriptional regulator [Klebsiella pasteurii]MDD9683408.1 FMN-binding negative transcriptional regulator [Klebsiella pasteurii]MDS7871239.1 FMN-binding negative transcriptional regulator [Klebsiella pasteurii]